MLSLASCKSASTGLREKGQMPLANKTIADSSTAAAMMIKTLGLENPLFEVRPASEWLLGGRAVAEGIQVRGRTENRGCCIKTLKAVEMARTPACDTPEIAGAFLEARVSPNPRRNLLASHYAVHVRSCSFFVTKNKYRAEILPAGVKRSNEFPCTNFCLYLMQARSCTRIAQSIRTL